ncbi:hypothetical protein KKH00_00765 [Patescibacteria group bacterium]|nr:hypothetical protein [Patescibacteria group bacterium]
MYQFFRNRHEKYYKEKKFHLIVDIVLVFVIIVLTGVVIWLFVFYYQVDKNIFLGINSVNKPLNRSILAMNLFLPDKVYQGAEFDGEIKLKNNSANDLEKIKLEFIAPDLKIKQNGKSLKNNLIVLDKIEAGEEIVITFNVVSLGKEGKASLTLACFIDLGKEKLKQAEIKKEIVIKVPKFKVTLKAEKNNILSDKEVLFRLNYKNEEEKKVDNIRLILATDNDNFSLDSIALVNNKKCKIKNNILIIESVEFGESDFIDFKVKFLKKRAVTEQKNNLAATVIYDIGEEKVRYISRSPKVCVLSDISLKSEGYYYSQQGDQLGIGPLPPIVDTQTNYWIFFEIDNFGNDLKNATFIATLPRDVIWINKKSLSAGNLQYGEASKRVIWTVDEVNKNGGNYRVGFEVGVAPSQKDIGKILKLLSDISFSVDDNFCEEEITKTDFKDISTDLEKDRLAKGKGEIAP